jgi:hypothetical protein
MKEEKTERNLSPLYSAARTDHLHLFVRSHSLNVLFNK